MIIFVCPEDLFMRPMDWLLLLLREEDIVEEQGSFRPAEEERRPEGGRLLLLLIRALLLPVLRLEFAVDAPAPPPVPTWGT